MVRFVLACAPICIGFAIRNRRSCSPSERGTSAPGKIRSILSAQRKANRNGQSEFGLRHARRESRQRLRAHDHVHHFLVEIGVARTLHNAVRQHAPVAIDAEAEQHDALFTLPLCATRISLVLLQMPDQIGLPRWARPAARHLRRGPSCAERAGAPPRPFPAV
jgi:hypothetical protein